MSVEKVISAADVKQLREMTGAGMMDCRQALIEAEGDFEKAIDLLRKKGQKLSVKRADREAKEGCILALVSADHTRGIVVRLSCETDFVSKNESFVALTKQFADIALEKFPATIEELLALPFEDITIGDKVTEQVGVIGEKVELSAYQTLEAAQIAPYIHMGNKAGVLVGLNKADAAYFDAGRDVAMQVAAMKPVALDKDGVDQTIIQREIEIGMEQARNEGKPEDMLDKIAMGRLNKFFQESTLLSQKFVKNNDQTVLQYLQSLDSGLTVTGFKHVSL